MPSILSARFILVYWIRWILFFELARLAFLLYNYTDSSALSWGDQWRCFVYGARMDASMAAYITLPVGLILILGHVFPVCRKNGILRLYTWIILLPILLIVACDLPAYGAWGYRLDVTPLKYLASPREAWASVSHLPVFWIFFFLALIYWATGKQFAAWIQKAGIEKSLSDKKWMSALFTLVGTAALIIPLRGGFQLAPLNQSSVYFSNNQFANLAAVNVTWNFMHSISHQTADTKNPYSFFQQPEADSLAKSLFRSSGTVTYLTDTVRVKKPNVLVIVWESLTQKAVGTRHHGIEITPGLNQLIREGIYFDHVYATGDRTDKGIVGVLSGYPAQPTHSIVKIPRKASSLPNLASKFRNAGYETAFTYGGELEFANMKAYLLSSGFSHFISKDDFSSRDQNSKWGAHDHVVKDSLQQLLSRLHQPFFSTWLTLSSHEPYETPFPVVIPGKQDADQFLNSIHYSDSCVFAFIQHCKKQPWWNQTLVVIVADHGHRLPYTNKRIDDFRIPVLFLGGALQQGGIIRSNTGSQTDIARTLLREAGLLKESGDFTWSRDLGGDASSGWAYFCFNDGFGFVRPSGYFVFDNVGKQIFEQQGTITEEDIRKGKAMEQMTLEDYLGR